MAKSQATFMKKQLEKNKMKKREDKEQRKLDRQQNSTGGDLDSMLAYVNEFGEIVSTPPEKKRVGATASWRGIDEGRRRRCPI